MTIWRYRRCPSCRVVFPGEGLKPLRSGYRRKRGGNLRRCPSCGHTAFSQAFAVADKRPPVSYAMLN